MCVLVSFGSGFFFTDSKMQGHSNEAALANAREKFWPALIAGWLFWPAMDVVTYSGLVPVRYRMLWINCCQIGWAAYVSALAASGSKNPTPARPRTDHTSPTGTASRPAIGCTAHSRT